MIVEGCLGIILGPEIEVTQNKTDRNEYLSRQMLCSLLSTAKVLTSQLTVVRRVLVHILDVVLLLTLELLQQGLCNLLDVQLCNVGSDIAGYRLVKIGNLTVNLCQLQISPCLVAQHDDILTFQDGFLVTCECGINLIQEEVAVIDDRVVIKNLIILVILLE